MAETTCPGRPKTGLPFATARIVGFPGRMAMPWTMMPGAPSAAMASVTPSRSPLELPPTRRTASAPRGRGVPGGHQLIPGHDDRHPGPREDGDLGVVEPGDQTHVLRAQPPAGA